MQQSYAGLHHCHNFNSTFSSNHFSSDMHCLGSKDERLITTPWLRSLATNQITAIISTQHLISIIFLQTCTAYV